MPEPRGCWRTKRIQTGHAAELRGEVLRNHFLQGVVYIATIPTTPTDTRDAGFA